jgi:hypothetical protein
MPAREIPLEETIAGATLFPTRVMSTITEAVAKLENLSQKRAFHDFS